MLSCLSSVILFYIKVVLPKKLKKLPSELFSHCSKLEEINIPKTVSVIGNGVFEDCTSLRSVSMPSCVVSIGQFAFSGCKSLEAVTIPQSVTHIKAVAFAFCSSLKSVEMPGSLKFIGDCVFDSCKNLKSFTIPESVIDIGLSAFSGTALPYTDDGFMIKDNCLLEYNPISLCLAKTRQSLSDFMDIALGVKDPPPAAADNDTAKNNVRTTIRIPNGIRLISRLLLPEQTEKIFIPRSVKYVYYEAFQNTKWYRNFPMEREFFIVGDDVLMKYMGDSKTVSIIDGVKRIAPAAFSKMYFRRSEGLMYDSEDEMNIPDDEKNTDSSPSPGLGEGGRKTPQNVMNKLYERLEIPPSVCEMDPYALSGAEFKIISLFGMDFSHDEIKADREHYFKGLKDIPYAVRLARDFDPSVKINKRLEVAAALTNYFNKTDKNDDRSKKYLEKRLFLAAELLMDKDRPEALMRLIESKDFLINTRRVTSLIKMAESKNKPELTELLRRLLPVFGM